MVQILRIAAGVFATFASLCAVQGVLAAQTCSFECVSADAVGQIGDGASNQPVLTPDGNRLAFVSAATNLLPGDTNGQPDVYVRDFALGTLERIGFGPQGVQGNGVPGYPAISADGRFVAFQSSATNLVVGDTNNQADVFVCDRQSGLTTLVSVGPLGVLCDGPSIAPTITPDGRFLVFASFATNLVAGDANGLRDVFLHDRQTGLTELVSVSSAGVQGDGMSGGSFLQAFASADGRYVAFGSAATNLVSGDLNGVFDVFLRDRALGTTTRVVMGLGGAEPDGDVDVTAFTPDGRFLGISSWATNLVAGDTNQFGDAFVLDRQSGTIERVSVSSTGAEPSSVSTNVVLSLDGRYALFKSFANDVIANDTNEAIDLFRRDRMGGVTERFATSEFGGQPPGNCFAGVLDGIGERVAFVCTADGLIAADTNGMSDVYVRGCSPQIVHCSGAPPAACPCANPGTPTSGCGNSRGKGGAVAAQGAPRTGADTLTLVAYDLPGSSPTMFLQGQSVIASLPFGDGRRCMGAPIVKLGVAHAWGGVARFGFGVPGVAPLSVLGQVPANGDWRYYQAWYRDAAPFCTSATFNISNAIEVLWGP